MRLIARLLYVAIGLVAVGLLAIVVWSLVDGYFTRDLLSRASKPGGLPASQVASGWDEVCTRGPYFHSDHDDLDWISDDPVMSIDDGEYLIVFLSGKTVIAVKKFYGPLDPDLCLPASAAPTFFATDRSRLTLRATR